MIKVALIGHGHIGKWHAEKCLKHPLAKLVALIDPCLSEKPDYGPIFYGKDYKDIPVDFDAVIIASPTYTHFEIMMYFINKNVHIFCEKPIDDNLSNAQKVLTNANKINKIIQIGHVERFNPLFQEFFFASENINYIQIVRDTPFRGRGLDTDVAYDLMIHDIDILGKIFSKKPDILSSTGKSVLSEKLDFVSCRLDYGKTKVDLKCGRLSPVDQRFWKVYEKERTIYIDLKLSKKSIFNYKDLSTKEEDLGKKDILYKEHDIFYKNIMGESETFVSVKDAVNSVEMVNSIIRMVKN